MLVVRSLCQLNVAVGFVVPAGTVIEQVFPEATVHPDHPLTKLCPRVGVAVSTTGLPTVNNAPQVPLGQLIPVGTLVTLPPPEGPIRVTITAACVAMPPGQLGIVGSSTVIVAYPMTRFPLSLTLADKLPMPHSPFGVTDPPAMFSNPGLSVFQATCAVMSLVSGGCL